MFLHVPETDANRFLVPTEYLDLMPTLVEAAMPGVVVPGVRVTRITRRIQLCTHGTA